MENAHNLFHIKILLVTLGSVSGIGLTFVVNPAAMSYFPVASLWSILFFLMIIMLGLSTQFVTIETVITAIMDENISVFRGKRIVVLFLVCSVLFFLGLPLSTQVRDGNVGCDVTNTCVVQSNQ